MTKTIAFLDVDFTLVNNTTSVTNRALIDFLVAQRFDKVYLVTGRNMNDFWQHVLQRGRPHTNWRHQTLQSVQDTLLAQGIPLVGVSLPYDHYFAQIQVTHSALPFRISKPGDSAQKFYLGFEQSIARLPDRAIHLEAITHQFSTQTGGSIYPDPLGGTTDVCPLSDALPNYLAVHEDTEKKGQFRFLLQAVVNENPDEPIKAFFFDDKVENTRSFQEIAAEFPTITAHTVLVDKVEGYKVPQTIAWACLDLDEQKHTFLHLFDPIRAKQAKRLKNHASANAAVNALIDKTTAAADLFFNAIPTAQSFAIFKDTCISAIATATDTLKAHRNVLGSLFSAIACFFNALKQSIFSRQTTIKPITFFDTRTDSHKILAQLSEDATHVFNNITSENASLSLTP